MKQERGSSWGFMSGAGNEWKKERKEHPNFSDEQIDQIVRDHHREGNFKVVSAC